MRIKLIKLIIKKEIIDIIRNRRALWEMILIPLLLTPTLSLAMPALLVFISQKFFQEQIVQKIPLPSEERREFQGQTIHIKNKKDAPLFLKTLKEARNLKITNLKYPDKALEKQNIQMIIKIPDKMEARLKKGENVKLVVALKPINMKTIIAYLKLKGIIDHFNQLRINQQEKRQAKVIPLKLAVDNRASPQEIGGFVLGLMVPIFTLFWLMMGGNSIAIDLTAGEKERKTLEFILSMPFKRSEILMGKFIVNLLISISSIFLAYLGMITPLFLFFSFLPSTWQMYGREFTITFTAFILLIIIFILLAGLLNCLQLALGLLAKSVKEAEYYLYPLVLLVIIPGVLASFSELSELTTISFMVPVLNLCYLMREALLGIYIPYHIIWGLGTSIIYIFLFFYITYLLFNREKVIFT